MNHDDANILRTVGALLGLAVTLHLVTGHRASQVHAAGAICSALALIGPEFFPPR